MFLKKSLLITLVLFFMNSQAQEFKLGKVTIAELQEKEHPKDPSAPAAILFKKGKADFEYENGFSLLTEVKVKIKIYKKEGFDWANATVPYSELYETVRFSDVVTYNLVDGKIEKTKLKSEGEFDEKTNKYWSRKKITMPNVKEGSVIEYSYTINNRGIGGLRDWNFQSRIPVNYSEYKTYIPEYFVFNQTQKGFIFPKITQDGQTRTIFINNNKIDYSEKQTTYVAENLPAMKDEQFVNNIENYMSSISQELIMTNFPYQPLKSFSTNWEAVVNQIYKYDEFGPELNKTGYFDDEIKTLIANLSTDEEKTIAIFNFVKSNVKWNEIYGYTCYNGVRRAFKEHVGNVADINLMLTAMLRYAGISANPVLVSTRSNGIALFPNRNAFNYVIAAIEINNDLVLLDATEKYALPNILPLRDLNWFGRLIRKDGTSAEVDLMPKKLTKETSNLSFVLKSDGTIDGKIRRQYTDYSALTFRKKNMTTSEETYLEGLEAQNNNIEISDYSRNSEADLTNPIVENYSFKDTKSVEIINNKIFIAPLVFLSSKENPFKQEIREYPVDFGFPLETKYNISIEIPDGYTVESMPKPINIVTGEDVGSFKYSIGNTGNHIQVAITTDINSAIVSADFYDVLKGFFQQIVDKETEKIVLKKI
jgi:transglutaminase-like putative cysteine protease